MKKSTKYTLKTIPIVVAFLCLLIFLFSFQFGGVYYSSNSTSMSPAATFENLSIDILVDKNGRYHVTENFDVTLKKQGLTEVVRFIPYFTSTSHIQEDGSIDKTILLARITEYELQTSGPESLKLYVDEITGYLTFGIKTVGTYEVNSKHNFEIYYIYDLGTDRNNQFDEFYHNIVGHDTDSPIKNVDFRVTFEDGNIDTNKIACYYGEYGSTNELDITVSGNTISGHISTLNANSGITLQVRFDNGYFDYKGNQNPILFIIGIVILITVAVLTWLFLDKHREKGPIIKPVEVTPPEFLNTFIAEYYGCGDVTSRAMTGNIIYFANKGYLKIEKLDENNFNLIKVKDIDDTEESYLKQTFKALFKKGDTIASTANKDYSVACYEMKQSVINVEESKMYDRKMTKKLNLISIISVVVSLIILYLVANCSVQLCLGHSSRLFTNNIFVLELTLVFTAVFIMKKDTCWWGMLMFLVPIVWCLINLYKGYYYLVDGAYLICVMSAVVCVIILMTKIQRERTKIAKEKLGRVLGFKNYIEKAEVSRIKVLAEENPNYFFDVLPYAYAFNLSDVWVEKFKDIIIPNPGWMESNDSVFDFVYFRTSFGRYNYLATRNVLDHRTKSIRSVAKTIGNISSGIGRSGGFSGGGFSGGGSGGGGFGAR